MTKSGKIFTLFQYIVALLALVFFLFPFWLVLINAAKTSGDIVTSTLSLPSNLGQLVTNIENVTSKSQFNYARSFFASTFITVVSLVLLTLFASMAAWVLARNKTKWSNILFMIFVSSMIIPFQVVMLPLMSVFRNVGEITGVKMFGTYFGIIFAYLGFGGSMSIFILHGFIKGIPYSLEEAARLDGASPEHVFFTVVMPLLRPIHMTILILNGIWIWNDFLLPSLVLGMSGEIKTLPIAVTSFVGSYVKQWDLILTATLLAILPVLVLFIFAQKQIIKGVVDGAIK